MHKPGRILKEGCFFRGLHILGYLCLGLGGLMLLGGFAGLVSTFIKTAPDLFSAPQYLDQPFALLILTLIGVYFGLYITLGCAGLLCIISGLLFIMLSTKSKNAHPIDKPSS